MEGNHKVTEMMSASHKGNSSAEPEAAPEKKSETESKTFPIVASIACRSSKIYRVFFMMIFSALDDDPLCNLSLTRPVVDRNKSCVNF